MTFNDKGFQPLMTLNSAYSAILRALARCHSLLFVVIVHSLTFPTSLFCVGQLMANGAE